jgi:undecaprenyl-diphosphatase
MVVGSFIDRALLSMAAGAKPRATRWAGMNKAQDVIETVAEVEQAVTHKAAAHDDNVFVRAAGKASEVADQPPLIALSVATILVGLVMRRPAVLRSGVRMLASHLVATGIKSALKNSIDRTRPSRALDEGHYLGKGTGADDTSLNSFPSGHTAGAVAVAQAVATESTAVGLPLQAAALGVAALQPSRGKHYLSDVAAGAVIGWMSERLTNAVLEQAERRLPWIRQ